MKAKGSTWKTNLIRKAKTIQKRVLVMSDEDYQTMLLVRYGKDSTADLTLDELKALVAHLDDRAGQSAKPKTSLPDAQARKIWQQWQSLHQAGEVRDKSERALNAYIKRQTGVESYRWLNRYQASTTIEALKKWQKRVGAV